MYFASGKSMLAAVFLCFYQCSLSAQSLATPGLLSHDESPGNIMYLHQYPSGLAKLKSGIAGLYAEQPYLLEGHSNYYVTYTLCSVAGNMALMMQQQGNEFNRYQKASFAYGRSLDSKFDIGIHLNFHHERFTGYAGRGVWSGSLGCGFQLSSVMRAELSLQDPVFLLSEKDKTYRINSRYLCFFTFAFSNQLDISAQFRMSEREYGDLQIGLQYGPHPNCRLHIAVNGMSGSLTFGLTYSAKQIRLSFFTGFHPVLGPTPSFGIMHRREGASS